MDESLQAIISEIGALSDRADSVRWELCAAIKTAFDELPSYSRGLTTGLMARLHKSSDQIYQLRDAETMREILKIDNPVLSPSHLSTLFHLRERFGMDNEKCQAWEQWAVDCGASVMELRTEIETALNGDEKKEFFRRVLRLSRLVERLWIDAEGVNMPTALREVTKIVLGAVREWIEKLNAWRS